MEMWLTLILAIFGGGGIATIIAEVLRWWRDRKLNEAKRDVEEATAAQVLTTTATGLLSKMQEKIDRLEHEVEEYRLELQQARNEIHVLEAKLEERQGYETQLGQLQERVRAAEEENNRLRDRLDR